LRVWADLYRLCWSFPSRNITQATRSGDSPCSFLRGLEVPSPSPFRDDRHPGFPHLKRLFFLPDRLLFPPPPLLRIFIQNLRACSTPPPRHLPQIPLSGVPTKMKSFRSVPLNILRLSVNNTAMAPRRHSRCFFGCPVSDLLFFGDPLPNLQRFDLIPDYQPKYLFLSTTDPPGSSCDPPPVEPLFPARFDWFLNKSTYKFLLCWVALSAWISLYRFRFLVIPQSGPKPFRVGHLLKDKSPPPLFNN